MSVSLAPTRWSRLASCFALLGFLITSSARSEERPNILWLSCEDISSHLGCYGDPHAITPNLDQLAAEGVRYSHAYTTAGVCAPTRSAIITGMYQNSIGTHHMRCRAVLPQWLTPFPMLVGEQGYYCTNNSKTDYQFSNPTPKEIWNASNRRAHWKNRSEKDQPFFAVFNFTGCHESGIASKEKYERVTQNLSEDERQDAAELSTLPPYYPDTPIVREDWKRNYELITAMDTWVGEKIQELKDAGEYENTIILFWSDHGIGLPRAKRWLYESGTHIPMIARIPERFRVEQQGRAGTVDSQLVSSIDFAPTVLNLAGATIPDYLQGRAFLGTDLSPPRDYIYGARDRMDERYDIIRSVRDEQFRYIRNFEPLKPYYQYMNTPEKGATMQEIRRVEAAGTAAPAVALFLTDHKPVEELYDVAADPHEIHNLADDPAYHDKLVEMQNALREWQNEIGDIGLIPEAEIAIREEQAGSRFAILHDQPGAEQKLARLVKIATQASDGVEALDDLIDGLQSDEPAVRYWAARGLGNLGQQAERAHGGLAAVMDDSSPNVRIAAARAVARLGDPESALPTLKQELASEHQWGRLAAAIVLDQMGEQARPALDALQEALHDQPNKYIVRVANKAINDLLGTKNRVP